INMDLCKSIASNYKDIVSVFCVVISVDEKENVNQDVVLIQPFESAANRRRYVKDDVYAIYEKLSKNETFSLQKKTWIVGHDVVTGEIALDLCEYFRTEKSAPQCFTSLIHHMIYEQYMSQKQSYVGSKLLDQRALLVQADVLFGVGPRLQLTASNIQQKTCPVIIPGIDMTDVSPSDYAVRDPFRVIICGRIGAEDDIIKNGQLALKAWATLVGEEERLDTSTITMIGCPEEERENLNRISSECARKRVSNNPINFLSHDRLLKEMYSYHLCIMPSLSEGFGLTGWEAISLGIPVIISKSSGLYNFLDQAKYRGYITAVDIAGGEENEHIDIPVLKREIKRVYDNFETYKENAKKLRELLREEYLWFHTATNFLESLGIKVAIHGDEPQMSPVITKFSSDVFTDRSEIIGKLFNCIESGVRIVNMYGKRGIGKSSILRFFNDGINGALSRVNSNKQGYFVNYSHIIDKIKVNYIDLSPHIEVTNALRSSLHATDSDDIFNFIVCNHILNSPSVNLFIFDDVSEVHLRDLFDFYKILTDSGKENFCLLIGSVSEFSFSELAVSLHHSFDVIPFSKKEIAEYAMNHDIQYDDGFVEKIEELSSGLPLYVKFLLKKSINYKGIESFRDMETYLTDLLKELEHNSPDCFKLTIYLALLSLTEESGKGVEVSKLQRYVHIDSIKECIQYLENDYSLLECNWVGRSLKMHDIIKDILIQITIKYHKNIIREILCSIEKDNLYERSYYILLLDKEFASDEQENNEIIEAIKTAVKNENYLFLVNIGRLFSKLHPLHEFDTINCNKLYVYILWGFIEGQIGVGDYPSAREVTDLIKFSIRGSEQDIEFKLSLAIAKLYHLQNDYQQAILMYTLIEQVAASNSRFLNYRISAFWGIAHSYRHEGKDYVMAMHFYDEAIAAAGSHLTSREWFKCKMEKISVLDCWEKFDEAEILLEEVRNVLSLYKEDEYVGTRISFKKSEARHLRISKKDYSKKVMTLLNEVLADYKQLKKRLQYNTLFDLGEYYRKNEDYKKAF
ncbi:MAG: glycosyltransferase, partial [Clostridium sp.]|nr:glycosyltransferase [Clostridium sp.]